MANVSMKFILLVATMAVVCSMCSGTRLPPRSDFGGIRPRPSPFNPVPRPSPFNPRPIRRDTRFRREAAIEPVNYYEVNDAAVLDEIVRQAREAPEDAAYFVEIPNYYYTK